NYKANALQKVFSFGSVVSSSGCPYELFTLSEKQRLMADGNNQNNSTTEEKPLEEPTQPLQRVSGEKQIAMAGVSRATS
ncbi:hypothetical protein LINPERHAP1_LOCUS39550, partial [Linum perenne]